MGLYRKVDFFIIYVSLLFFYIICSNDKKKWVFLFKIYIFFIILGYFLKYIFNKCMVYCIW